MSGFNLRDRSSNAVSRIARRALGALLVAFAVFAAGCHNNNLDSGYGITWVTLSDSPGDFTSYIVNIDSITLTRSDSAVVTALATVETVDFTKLRNIEEMWGAGTVPIGTYLSASITIDYTGALIGVLVNGVPQEATVVNTAGTAVTTAVVNVVFDPAHPLVISPTYATTSAQRLAIDLDLAASTPQINFATNPATVTVQPYFTVAVAPADNKPIRIRGPLINSNVDEGTYTVYIRPFHDVVDNLGTLSLFSTANTIFTTNGVVRQGAPGVTQLSQSSAGATVTAAYATFTPTATATAPAGKFYAIYVIAGSTLEDVYTSGLEGDVIARSGDTLTVQGATLTLNDGISTYYPGNSQVLLGPSTLVTADGTTLSGLNYSDVAAGQHIIARGIYSVSGTTVILDATGASATNTGSVRLVPTSLWGSIVSTGAGTVNLNLQTINDFPVSDYSFAGNGTSAAATPVAADFPVGSGTLTLPDVTPGDPLWIDGRFAPFGSSPPAFLATSVNDELSVQVAGQSAGATMTQTDPTPLSCAQGNFDCVTASLQVRWSGTGTSAPFTALNAAGVTIDLGNAALTSALIRIGPESIPLSSLAASPLIVGTPPLPTVSQTADVTGAVPVTLNPIFLPAYTYGTPSAAAPDGITEFSVFGSFTTGLAATLPSEPAQLLVARGTFNRATNTFTAISIDIVL